MVHSDPVADMLTRLRNGIIAGKKEVEVPYSKLKEGIAQCLTKLGFVRTYQVLSEDIPSQKKLRITLKYVGQEPAIYKIMRESKPGKRVYLPAKKRPSGRPQHSVSILTTSYGVLSDREASEKNVGGEVLCTIW